MLPTFSSTLLSLRLHYPVPDATSASSVLPIECLAEEDFKKELDRKIPTWNALAPSKDLTLHVHYTKTDQSRFSASYMLSESRFEENYNQDTNWHTIHEASTCIEASRALLFSLSLALAELKELEKKKAAPLPHVAIPYPSWEFGALLQMTPGFLPKLGTELRMDAKRSLFSVKMPKESLEFPLYLQLSAGFTPTQNAPELKDVSLTSFTGSVGICAGFFRTETLTGMACTSFQLGHIYASGTTEASKFFTYTSLQPMLHVAYTIEPHSGLSLLFQGGLMLAFSEHRFVSAEKTGYSFNLTPVHLSFGSGLGFVF